MLTYSDWLTMYRRFTGVSDLEARGVGTVQMNIGRQLVLKAIASYITEETFTASTVANQQEYLLPARVNKLSNLSITVGAIKYSPKEVTDPLKWNQITIRNTPTSTIPQFYYVDKYRLSIFPTPGASGNTITALVTLKEPDLNTEDQTIGSITATNGSTTVTGSSTAFSSSHVGWQMLMPDGMWYEVKSVASATSLTLVQQYEGATTSGASYRLGQASVIPEEGQILPVYFAAMQYYMGVENDKRMSMYRSLYTGSEVVGDGILGLVESYRNRSTTQLTSGYRDSIQTLNPNNYPQDIGP